MGGGNVYNMEGLMGVDTSDVRKTIMFLMEGHPTKMECSAMIIIDKGPNKGLLFEPNTGSNLGTSCGFSILSRIFTTANSSNHTMAGLQIQPHDGSITQWVFSFLPL